jgi:F0F1-type ATP synthase membrane subunit b/b'
MVIATNNWRIWLAGMAVSLVIFAVVFFTVIQPSANTANQAIKTGLQQSGQLIKQSENQLSSAAAQTSAASGQPATVSKQAQQQLSNASKLTACVATAGTDPSKLQACQVKYAG